MISDLFWSPAQLGYDEFTNARYFPEYVEENLNLAFEAVVL
jgi:hypothetical protein